MIDIYYANIDEDQVGLTAISLVDMPAIERNFECFRAEVTPTKHKLSAEHSKHEIFGPAIRADYPIYRLSKSGKPYYIVFTREVIEQMILKFSKNSYNNLVDLQHDGQMIEGVTMIEFFIKDSTRGISPVDYEDIEEGSLFVRYKVEDEALWDQIINGNQLNGFSIECYIGLSEEPSEQKMEIQEPQNIDELIDMLTQN